MSVNVYGQALYSLTAEEQISGDVLAELTQLDESFQQEPDFLRLLSAPNVPVQERCDILDTCFRGNVHPYVLNFLKILTEKSVIKTFPQCVKAYRACYHQDHNILPVTAVTAVPLSGQQVQRLSEKLSTLTGKTAQLTNRVDPACLGGVLLDYDGKRVDGSVATRLEAVRKKLQNTVL